MKSKNIVFNLASKLLQPMNVVPHQVAKQQVRTELSKSHKLMIDLGIIRPSSTGIYSILPLGMRSLDKMRSIVKLEMSKLYAQEVKLPSLTDSSLWKKSDRWRTEGFGMFMLKDRHNKDMILSPTNEEVAADLVASMPQISHHQLPILFYQMSTKFRDEIKPRCGLLKSKEFEMKDLYSFDKSIEAAKETYESVTKAYQNIFDSLGIPVLRVKADTGEMKGIFSHEYHICNDLGEDIIIKCNSCSHSFNSEQKEVSECENCNSNSISRLKGIEVGHTFLLDTVYTKPMNAIFKTVAGSVEPLVMASYGLGLTRTLAAGIEHLSSDDYITWPRSVSPFSIAIITPKGGSKEYEVGKRLSNDLYQKLHDIASLHNDVIIDDRENLTIGKRLLYSKRMGFPYVIVIGSKITNSPPLYEIIHIQSNESKLVTFEEIISFLSISYYQKSLKEALG